jgi:hypothetical protein
MNNRMRHFLGLPEKRAHKDSEWEIAVLRTGEYYIRTPYRLSQSEKITNFNKFTKYTSSWSNIRVNIISSINKLYEHSYVYMRLHTYTPDNILALNTACRYEETTIKDKNMHLFYLPNCHDERVWKMFFEARIAKQEGKILFSLKHQPDNWKEIVECYYKIIEDTFNLHKSISVFKEDLEQCCLLCYSIMDDDSLIIAKTDLSEADILSVLGNIACDESLELIITRQK